MTTCLKVVDTRRVVEALTRTAAANNVRVRIRITPTNAFKKLMRRHWSPFHSADSLTPCAKVLMCNDGVKPLEHFALLVLKTLPLFICCNESCEDFYMLIATFVKEDGVLGHDRSNAVSSAWFGFAQYSLNSHFYFNCPGNFTPFFTSQHSGVASKSTPAIIYICFSQSPCGSCIRLVIQGGENPVLQNGSKVRYHVTAVTVA
jgi:hypothetical protein